MNRTVRNTMAAFAALGAVLGARAEGLYVGGSLSAPDYGSAIAGAGDGSGGRGPGLRVYGGWQATPNFAVEAGLFNLGRTAGGSGGSAHIRGVSLDGVGRYAVAPDWWGYASVGVAQGRVVAAGRDDDSLGLKLGLGLQVDLNRSTALRVGYEQYRFRDAFDARPRVGQALVGVQMAF